MKDHRAHITLKFGRKEGKKGRETVEGKSDAGRRRCKQGVVFNLHGGKMPYRDPHKPTNHCTAWRYDISMSGISNIGKGLEVAKFPPDTVGPV